MDDDDPGYDVGYDMASYDMYAQAARARERGELDLWFEFHEPKSIQGWEEWEAKNGPVEEFEKRWK